MWSNLEAHEEDEVFSFITTWLSLQILRLWAIVDHFGP